jgi:ATP-dependent helicase/nuclease subunit B
MATGELWYGSSFSRLRDNAFDWLDERAGSSPESAWFLEANEYQHDAIADAWREDYDGLRLQVSGLARFALTIHERLFGPYPDIGTLERRRLIEQALLAIDDNAGVEEARRHASSFSELFRELEAQGSHDVAELEETLAGSACSAAQQDAIVTAYREYQELQDVLLHPAAESRSEKLTAVANAEESIQDAMPHLDAIVLSGLYDPSAVEVAVITRLAEEFPVRVVLPTPVTDEPLAGVGAGVAETMETLTDVGFEPEPVRPATTQPLTDVVSRLYQPGDALESVPAGLSWYEAPTPDREIRHLARTIRERLVTADGCEPDDVLVLAPGLLSYRDGIADVFEAYGIDHAYQVSVLLERTYAGQAVLDAIGFCERPSADRLARLVSNPLVDIEDVDAAEVAAVQRRLYTTAIERLRAELELSDSGVAALVEQVTAVQEAAADGVVQAVTDLLEVLGLEDAVEELDSTASIDAGYEQRALSRVTQILASVQRVCEELEPAEPLVEVATALEGVRVPPPPQVTEGRVEIIGLQDTPMAEFDELYVLGATAEQLSGSETRPRYFQHVGEELGVFDRHSQRDRARYRFGLLLANAQRVHITTPETTIGDDPLLVSPFVDELARVTGLEPVTGLSGERRGAREDLQRAIAGATPGDVQTALSAANADGAVSEQFVELACRGSECGSHRGQRALTAHDGQLSAAGIDALDDRLTKTPFSPSRLTQYAKCGFKYMLQVGWGLDDDDDIEPGMSSLVVGSIVHDTVEAFFGGLQSTEGDPVDLTAWERAELEQRLLSVGLETVSAETELVDDVFSDATLRALFAGLGTPETNEYYDPPGAGGQLTVGGTFVQFLEAELERAADGHRPTMFEVEFGEKEAEAVPETVSIPIGGRLDRVDTSTAGDVTVFDYKAASVSSVRSRENNARDGVDFQLPLYMLGAPGLVEGTADVSPAAVAARYYVMNTDPTVKLRRSLKDRFNDIDFEAFMTETVPERLDAVQTGIEHGSFHPTVAGASVAQCEYCAFRDVCDVRHHRRYDVMNYIDEEAYPAYVPAGVRPGDVAEQLLGGGGDE